MTTKEITTEEDLATYDPEPLKISRIGNAEKTYHVDVEVTVGDADLDGWLTSLSERLPVDARVLRLDHHVLVRFYGSRATINQLHEVLVGGMTEEEASTALDEFVAES